ncbi:MAG: S8 family serine peptidase [Elusimicrobia bacterium]|nr:S8 family serine peptidase [Elusimicrobiota bacterium]
MAQRLADADPRGVLMKRLVSLTVSLSLLSLSLGPAAPSALALALAATARTAPVALAPTGVIGAASLQLAAPAAGLGLSPAAAGLQGLALDVLPAPAGALAVQALQTPAGQPTPFARSLEALSAEAPDFAKAGDQGSSALARDDFQARIGDGPAPAPDAPEVEFIVSGSEGSQGQITQDVFPGYLNERGLAPAARRAALEQQLRQLGVSPSLLQMHEASALGTIRRTNTAVIRVPRARADGLAENLRASGLDVQVGRIFTVPEKIQLDAQARTVGLKEMSGVIGADKLQEALKKVLGDPSKPKAAPSRWLRKALGLAAENPVLPWAVLDTWVAVAHPYLKGKFLKSVKNEDDGEEHGTHTAGTVVGVDIFNTHGRTYNIFPNGSASEGDILMKLNLAYSDGALATTNSWGDGRGNPEGAIEKLFVKGAAEGVHHDIAAGNSGSSKNTVGGPAIAVHDVDLVINGKKIGTVKRIKAIAAADADKATAYFSSRGKGSRETSTNPKYKNYPQKPDETGVGVNLRAPVPKGTHDPELGGPASAMSGTSMSTPGAFGAHLLLTRGILVLLKDYLPALPGPKLTEFAMDLARYSMTQTDLKGQPADDQGDGFINVWAAFEHAGKLLRENAPKGIGTNLRQTARALYGLPAPPKAESAGRGFSFNDPTPFGSFRTYRSPDGRSVRVYGWSLSPQTFLQMIVLGLLGGPLLFALGLGGSLWWAITGMGLAPLVVDLLKPTWIYSRD